MFFRLTNSENFNLSNSAGSEIENLHSQSNRTTNEQVTYFCIISQEIHLEYCKGEVRMTKGDPRDWPSFTFYCLLKKVMFVEFYQQILELQL